MGAELNQTSLKVTISDLHDGHDAEQVISIFELIMARSRESMIMQYLNGSDPVPANVEALNVAQRAVITGRCDREWLFQLKVHLRGKALKVDSNPL